MNTLEFLKEYQRMCGSYEDCDKCPLHKKTCLNDYTTPLSMTEEELTQFIENVEDWSRNHPLIIDWTKVPHNTPVLVRNSPTSEWIEHYFCAYIPHCTNGRFVTFYGGDGTSAHNIIHWYYCKLAPGVDPTPYLKQEEE